MKIMAQFQLAADLSDPLDPFICALLRLGSFSVRGCSASTVLVAYKVLVEGKVASSSEFESGSACGWLDSLHGDEGPSALWPLVFVPGYLR